MTRALKPVIAAIFLAVLSLGCAKIYTAPDFDTYYRAHKTVAILPFQVSYDPSKLPKDMTSDMVTKLQRDEAYSLQQQMFIHFLERKAKGEYTVDFQDINQTNVALHQAGIVYDSVSNFPKKFLRDTLKVDALLSGHIRRAKPMSTGAAVALGVLFGVWGSTNEVNVTVSIHDGETGTLIWNYEHKAEGSVGSSSEGLAKNLIADISRSFPYKRKRDAK